MAFAVLMPTLFLGSCLCAEEVDRRDVNLISLDEEWRIGAALAEVLSQELRLVADPEVNAFAISGGHVYVSTGLIMTVENAAELAGVMAHEVAYRAVRHATERMTQAYGVDALLRLLVRGNAGLLR